MVLFREVLTPHVEKVIEMKSKYITIMNLGTNDVFVDFDTKATTDSLVIPVGYGRSFYFYNRIEDVHVIAEGETTIQIDNLR